VIKVGVVCVKNALETTNLSFRINKNNKSTNFDAKIIIRLKLTPPSDHIHRYRLGDLYRRDVAVLSGGFLAGDAPTIARFYALYQARFVALVRDQGRVDDDQVFFLQLKIIRIKIKDFKGNNAQKQKEIYAIKK
jgi:hypothetical protein